MPAASLELKALRQESARARACAGASWRARRKLHRDVSLSLAGAVFAAGRAPEPLMFFSGDRWLSSAVDQVGETVSAVTQALTPVNGTPLPIRSIDALLRENLYDADLTDEERARLAEHAQQVATRQRARAARDVDALRRAGGCWFPDDPTPRSGWDDVIDDIQAKFQRWR